MDISDNSSNSNHNQPKMVESFLKQAKSKNEKVQSTKNDKISGKERIKKSISLKSIGMNIFIALILISSPLFIILSFEYPGAEIENITIDGNFDDWEDKVSYEDQINDQTDPNIDITECKLAREDTKTSIYVEVEGEILKGHKDENGKLKPDILRILIDSDKDKNTGYKCNDIGADYLFEIQGKNGKAIVSPVYMFDPQYRTETPRQRNDWLGWKQYHQGNQQVVTNEGRIEAQVSLPYYIDKPRDIDYNDQILATVQIMDVNGNEDISDNIISNSPELLIIKQRSIIDDVLLNDVSEILELEFIARGADITINSITFDNEGGGILSQLPLPIFIEKDTSEKYNLQLDTSSIEAGDSVSVSLGSSEDIIINEDIPIQLIGNGVNVYVKEIPEKIIIDGAFGDWKNIDKIQDSDEYSINNPNVNIANYAVFGSENDVSFYLDVEGVILEGSLFPQETLIGDVELNKKINAFASEHLKIPNLPPRTGEDSIFIFLDTDLDAQTGYSPEWFPFGADYYIEILGQEGKIQKSNYFKFTGGINHVEWRWSDSLGEIPVEILSSQFEAQISFEELGIKETPRVFYYIMDWTYMADTSKLDFEIPTQVYNIYEKIMSGGVRGVNSYLVINELKYDSNDVGNQFIEIFNPTNEDMGIGFSIYRVRGPKVSKILTLQEEVPSLMYHTWNPENGGFEIGDLLILKDPFDNTVDKVIIPYNLSSGSSLQRYIDENDGMPVDTGGNEDYFTGDFFVTNASLPNTLDFPNSQAKGIPEFYDILIPILMLFACIILIRICLKKSKKELNY